ncbi:peptidase M13 [Bowdeniella nasicola]|uniref:Peptidase M13 n=1 Tax=Bowdeniella nasicola TaxID=208480 RepID=A0A1Q5Q3W5_9ACTO|nr:M13-type metalloendopeptidase [Bowdeniella nasicola]OKL54497.1 peptidase M13 [Bowdeniella nasicola]
MTSQVRIQDDLFAALNGDWLEQHTIPADRARDGAFHHLRDQSEIHVREIVEQCAADDGGDADAMKIGRLYRAFMDTDAIEAAGLAPLADVLDVVNSAQTKDELAAALGRLTPGGGPGLFGIGVMSDLNNPDRYALYFGQSGLALPDESYYREDAHAETRAAYVKHLEKMVTLGELAADPAEAAQRIMAVETAIAAGHRDRVASRDIQRMNNPVTREELAESLGAFDFEGWRQAAGITDAQLEVMIVQVPEFMEHAGKLWADTDLADLKLWATWHLLHGAAPYLTSAIVDENFHMYGATLTGAEELRERWKRGVGVVEGALGESVGKLYVEAHFPPSHKEAMDELVANLIEAYRRSITTLEWMTDETKAKALAKLEAFTPKVGYPVRWRDYSSLEIPEGDVIAAVRASNRFEFARELNKLGGPIDRDEWLMTPQTVNAYYMPTMNEIVFPAAILQPPFFDADADDATNYGGIGAVIGHEIGHGFDDQGSQFDGRGQVVNWWTDTDREEFEKRTSSLIEQYNAFVPSQLPEGTPHHVNGALTIGENIGDLGGLSIGLKAYEIALEKQGKALADAPVIDGLTGLQRIFYSWAHIWREKARDAEVIRLLTIDPHSPAEFRCNGVPRNMAAFYEAFDVTEGDGMWLEPEKRVEIW